MDEFLAIAKALSDEGRVRILLALKGRELCVCQIVELLGLAPSTVSKHMSILKQAGLVRVRKDGRWAYYRLAEEDVSPMIKQALEWVFESVGTSLRAQEDQKRLKRITERDKEILCRLMNKNWQKTQS